MSHMTSLVVHTWFGVVQWGSMWFDVVISHTAETDTVIPDLLVSEGPLLQYDSPIRTRNQNPNPFSDSNSNPNPKLTQR